jgi:hypothetical protein
MRLILAIICLAASLSAADLPPGRYGAHFTLDGKTETHLVSLARNGDLVSVAPDSGEPMMQGKIVPGTAARRLLLARHRFVPEGLLVDVIVADITEDGYATGYAHRSLNGEPRERIAIIVRRE